MHTFKGCRKQAAAFEALSYSRLVISTTGKVGFVRKSTPFGVLFLLCVVDAIDIAFRALKVCHALFGISAVTTAVIAQCIQRAIAKQAVKFAAILYFVAREILAGFILKETVGIFHTVASKNSVFMHPFHGSFRFHQFQGKCRIRAKAECVF